MRVLHIMSGSDPVHGGPVTALRGLAEAQASEGVQTSILATFVKGSDTSVLSDARLRGVNVHLVGPSRGRRDLHPALSNVVDHLVADAQIVHIHGLWQEIQHQAAKFAQRHGVAYIIRPCGMLSPWALSQGRIRKRAYMLWRLRRTLNRAGAIHFTSASERDLARPHRLRAPVIVEPNGVDFCEFDALPRRGTMRARYKIPPERLVVLYLGRLHPKKGLHLLIPAFARAPSHNATLVIAGPDEGGYRGRLEAMVDRHNLRHQVVFTGMVAREDRVAAFLDADVFVLPSHDENFGVTVVESLAAGTPVIISDQVGIHEQVMSARVGSVTPSRVDPLAEQLTRWLSDPDLRRSTADRARAFAWAHFDWRQIARRWTEHYTRLCRQA